VRVGDYSGYANVDRRINEHIHKIRIGGITQNGSAGPCAITVVRGANRAPCLVRGRQLLASHFALWTFAAEVLETQASIAHFPTKFLLEEKRTPFASDLREASNASRAGR